MKLRNNKKLEIDVFLRGKSIDLIALNEEVIENSNWYKWYNDEETTMFMQYHYFPNTKDLQKKYLLNEILNNENKVQLGIFHKKNKILIGVISLNNIDYKNRECEISGMLGEKKYRNLSNYLEAAKLIIIHGFNTFNMNRIYSGAINKEVENMFVKFLGFKNEGRLRENIFKNGKYFDTYIHSILKSEFKKFKFYKQ